MRPEEPLSPDWAQETAFDLPGFTLPLNFTPAPDAVSIPLAVSVAVHVAGPVVD